MCGIAGFFDPGQRIEDASSRIESMLDRIRHRGPDDWGIWHSPDRRWTLGHRRLAILDISPSGRQPYVSPSGRHVVTFNGEIYNFKQVHAELGCPVLKSSGDTAVVAAALDRWGIESTIEKLNGMFAIGIWDRDSSEFVLARDRLGKKPVYYGYHNGIFAFASELKPLQVIEGFCDKICPMALEELMKYGYISAPRSIFQRVSKLRAGEFIRFDSQSSSPSPRLFKYWNPVASPEDQIPDDPQEFLEMLESMLIDSVKLRMISDVSLGAFLSGGLDSSLVCALMSRVSSSPIKTFTIGFHESKFDEAVDAKKIAKHLETEHHEQYLSGQDALKLIEQMPVVYSEPFADSSQIPTRLVSQFARESVTVALSGDGGDELFSGYTRYKQVLAGWKSKQTWTGKSLTGALNFANHLAPGWTSQWVTKALNREAGSWGRQKIFRRELERRNASDFLEYYQLNNSAYCILDSLLQPEFRAGAPTQGSSWERFGNHAVQMSTHDIHYYLPEDILTKVDRASMSVSLETRNPILDYRLVGPCLAALNKFDGGNSPKWALRSILKKYVPAELVDRPKQGFGIPFHQWLSREIHPLMESLITPARIRADGFFDHQKVSVAWQEFLAGDQVTWGVIFWRMMIFQTWHDKFWQTENPPASPVSTRSGGVGP